MMNQCSLARLVFLLVFLRLQRAVLGQFFLMFVTLRALLAAVCMLFPGDGMGWGIDCRDVSMR